MPPSPVVEALYMRRMALFPRRAALQSGAGPSQLSIAGLNLATLAEQYGTPLYLYDEETLDWALESYRQALSDHYPGPGAITYAGKAFLCRAIASWANRHGLWVDCTGAGEIGIAVAAGVARSHILVHGVNKSPSDLHAAMQHAGVIVVDNLTELGRLSELFAALTDGEPRPELWLRLKPGLAVDTHSYTQTGQEDSKFGLSPAEASHAVQICLGQGLPLRGLHFHQGSHFHDPSPLGPAIETALDWSAACLAQTGWQPSVLCCGGGWGVPYHEDDLPHQSIEAYVAFAASRVRAGCQSRGLALPRLQFEPGRSLVARAGVVLYRVGAVKHTAARRWLLLDGGMADNPRKALYGARYSALPVCQPDRPLSGSAWLAGPYCESGDVLVEDLPLPDIQPGELLAMPVAGAYHISMSSNYNGACRPAVLWLSAGPAASAHLILERQQPEDLLLRDHPLPDLWGGRRDVFGYARNQRFLSDYLAAARRVRRQCRRPAPGPVRFPAQWPWP